MMENDEIYKQFENVFKDKTFSLPIQRDDNDFLTNLDDVLGEYQARISAERLSDYPLT